MKVNVKTIENDKCQRILKATNYEIFDNNICTLTDGKDACEGDSGGTIITYD